MDFLSDEYPTDVSGEFDSGSDDDFVPEEHEPDSESEYNSDDSDVDFVEQETRESAAVDANVMVMSKDQQIQYSKEPLPFHRLSKHLVISFASRQGRTCICSFSYYYLVLFSIIIVFDTQESKGNSTSVGRYEEKKAHHTEAVFDHDLRACMISYVPKTRRFVTLLSTYHSSVEIHHQELEKKPEIIKFYNRTKGGVDVLDKLVGTYRCKRKVNRWPMALLCKFWMYQHAMHS